MYASEPFKLFKRSKKSFKIIFVTFFPDFLTLDHIFELLKWEIWSGLYMSEFPYHPGVQNMFQIFSSPVRSRLKFTFSKIGDRRKSAKKFAGFYEFLATFN